MKNNIFVSALAALALVSCSDNKYDTFDKSAADRLEDMKEQYANVLVEDGGLWAMEYFANEKEKGYTFVMKFTDDGWVEIFANHDFIKNEYRTEKSLWAMIADNGPVLTFNSYNTLFHVFSDPADIPYDNQGIKNEDAIGSGDETGFGHEGDYEFQIMKIEDDGNTVRMLGKKRLYDIYLRKLDPNTDIQGYLESVADIPSRFSKDFNDMTLTAEDGEVFRFYNLSTSVPSIYPLYGDKIDQTTSQNGIFTDKGIRFRKPLEVTRADGSTFEVTELNFNADGTLSGPGVSDVRVNSPMENLLRVGKNWNIQMDSFTGKAKDLYEAALKASTEYGSKYVLGQVDFTYKGYNGQNTFHLVTRIGQKICYDYADIDHEMIGYGNIKPSSDFHISVYEKSNNSSKYEQEIPEYAAFKNYFSGDFVMTGEDPMCPNFVKFVDKNDSGSSFVIMLDPTK